MSKLPKLPKFVPAGDFPKEQKKDQEKLVKEWFDDKLIPWWSKAAIVLCPGLKKAERAKTWCKYCGRKHSKREECANLHKIEDLTAPSTKFDDDGDPIPNKRVGRYSTKEPKR